MENIMDLRQIPRCKEGDTLAKQELVSRISNYANDIIYYERTDTEQFISY